MGSGVRRSVPVVAAVFVVLAIPALLAWINWRANQDGPAPLQAVAQASPVSSSPATSTVAMPSPAILSARPGAATPRAGSRERTRSADAEPRVRRERGGTPADRERSPRSRDRERGERAPGGRDGGKDATPAARSGGEAGVGGDIGTL